MPRRLVPLVAGSFFHIYNRGHNRSLIFQQPDDYGLFLRKFRQFVSPEHLETIAYVLMPNHFHILGRVCTDGLSRAMQKFGIAFTNILNRQYGRVGTVFQGPFQAKPVEKDEYLLHVTKYIHRNPVQAGLARQPEDWVYSSYREYVGLRNGTLPLTEFIHAVLDGRPANDAERHARYARFVADMQPTPAGLNLSFDE